jgi:hypothetical protein
VSVSGHAVYSVSCTIILAPAQGASRASSKGSRFVIALPHGTQEGVETELIL